MHVGIHAIGDTCFCTAYRCFASASNKSTNKLSVCVSSAESKEHNFTIAITPTMTMKGTGGGAGAVMSTTPTNIEFIYSKWQTTPTKRRYGDDRVFKFYLLNCFPNSQHSSDTIIYCYLVEFVPLVCDEVDGDVRWRNVERMSSGIRCRCAFPHTHES